MYKRIMLAYDGSDAGQKALLDCQELANWSQSELFLVAVMPSAMSFVGLEGGVYDIELEEREKKKYQPGAQVVWKWGEHTARGVVRKVFTHRIERTMKGTTVTRAADRNNPAYLIEQEDGDAVLKSHSELHAS